MLHKRYALIALLIVLHTPWSVKGKEEEQVSVGAIALQNLWQPESAPSVGLLPLETESSPAELYRNYVIPLYQYGKRQPLFDLDKAVFPVESPFSILPLDVLQCIIIHLDPQSTLTLTLVSKAWNLRIHELLKQYHNILPYMTSRLLFNPGHVRTRDEFFELALTPALRSDFSKSVISKYSQQLPFKKDSFYRGRVCLSLDGQESTDKMLLDYVIRYLQLPENFIEQVLEDFIGPLSKDLICPPMSSLLDESGVCGELISPRALCGIIGEADMLPKMCEEYEHKITLPPVFERLTIQGSPTAEVDLLDCVFKFLHPECKFNTLEISHLLLTSSTCFNILNSALSQAALKTVEKIKNLRILIDQDLETPSYVSAEYLRRFVNLFQNVELQIICSQKPSQDTKCLKLPKLNILQAFGLTEGYENMPKHPDLSIFIHYPHISHAESSEYCINLKSSDELLSHSLRTIKFISKIPPEQGSMDCLKKSKLMVDQLNPLRVQNFKQLSFSNPEGIEIQKIEWK